MNNTENTPPKEKKPSFFRSSVFSALVVIAIAAVWLASGYIRDAQYSPLGNNNTTKTNQNTPQNVQSNAQGEQKTLPKVRTRISRAEYKQPEIVIRGGKIEAERAVIIRSEIGGKVAAATTIKEGQYIKKGELLCGIAVNNREAEKKEAEALMRLRDLQLKAAQKLAKQGHNTRMSLAQSQANYNTAQSILERAKLALANTKITAPFNGIVEKIYVDIGDFMNPGAPCAKIIDMTPPIIAGQLTEEEVSKIKLNHSGWAILPGGERLDGFIRYIAHSADPKTRTYRIELEADPPDAALRDLVRDGITVQIYLPLDKILAHRIRPSILTLNEKGTVGLRIVINQNGKSIVRFKPVTIIAGNANYYWITGLKQSTQIITVGQEYVSDNAQVTVERDNPQEKPSQTEIPKRTPESRL